MATFASVGVVAVVEGEFDVTVNGQLLRVFVPPGLGVAGVDDEAFVAQVVRVLVNRVIPLPPVLDVAQLIANDPQLFQQVSDALGDDETDTV